MSELAIIEHQSPILDIGAWGEALIFADRLALKISDTEFVPTALRGRPEAVTALILYGMEIGVTPMQALQGMHIVEGRPAPSAELKRALIMREGHTVTIHEATGTRARVSGLRRGRPESERLPIEWTIDMARAAGLLGRKNWQTYPRAMLVARATDDLARMLFPDVIKGLGYSAEDESTDADIWGAPEPIAEETQRRPALQRKRRKAAEPVPPVVDVPLMEPVRHADDVPTAEGGETPRLRPERPPVAPEATEAPPSRQTGAPSRVAPEDVPLPIFTEAPAPSIPHGEPERPGAEPPPSEQAGAGPPPLGAGPMRALQAGLTRELGTVATREERHALVSAILGREIDTTKTLSRPDGLKVLDVLGQFESGAATFEPDFSADDGQIHFKILDTRPIPPEET